MIDTIAKAIVRNLERGGIWINPNTQRVLARPHSIPGEPWGRGIHPCETLPKKGFNWVEFEIREWDRWEVFREVFPNIDPLDESRVEAHEQFNPFDGGQIPPPPRNWEEEWGIVDQVLFRRQMADAMAWAEAWVKDQAEIARVMRLVQ